MNIQKQFQKGFTLIELVIVIVILGILAAVAVPRYVDLSTEATTAAKSGFEGSVKSGFAIYIGQNKSNPTVTQLAAMLPGTTAVATGIQMSIDGDNYIVTTFTDNGCSAATAAVGDTVACVTGVTP